MNEQTFSEITEFIACSALFDEFKKSQDKETIYRIASHMLDEGTLSKESYDSVIDIINKYKNVVDQKISSSIELLSNSTITTSSEDLQGDLQILKEVFNTWKELSNQFAEKYDIANITNDITEKYFK